MHIAYLRVSSASQNLDRQEAIAAHCEKVFTEKASAKDAKRPQLEALQDFAREGDTIHVASIDRLARNILDLHALLDGFTANGITVKFHKEGLTFTPDSQASPTDKLMLAVMGAVAEFERALINERRREGVAAARAAGKTGHRPLTLTPEQIEDVKRQVDQGISKAEVARRHNVSRNIVYRILNGTYAPSDAPTDDSPDNHTPEG